MFLNDVFGKYSFCMIFFGNICTRLVLVYVDFMIYDFKCWTCLYF